MSAEGGSALSANVSIALAINNISINERRLNKQYNHHAMAA